MNANNHRHKEFSKSLLILNMFRLAAHIMKLILVLVLTGMQHAFAQPPGTSWDLVQQLDSIRNTRTTAAYFAGIYLSTTVKAIRFAEKRSPEEQRALILFEKNFAGFFFEAVRAVSEQRTPPVVWAGYFMHDSVSPVRLQLLGINAHINGDLWQALTAAFSREELRRFRPCYRAFNRELKKEFDEFFEEAADHDIRFALSGELIPGISHAAGHRLLKHWRKRQYKLALFYYSDQPRFRKMLQRVTQKRESLNRLICNHF